MVIIVTVILKSVAFNDVNMVITFQEGEKFQHSIHEWSEFCDTLYDF